MNFEIMKNHGAIAVVLLAFAATFGLAATNDPTTSLQKALFEEEANHTLGAAIQLYQAVVTQFDKDRKLAATAVFRLGECYRKQGNTNEAIASYQRVLSEFTDQSQLAELSRQSLSGLGVRPGNAAALMPASNAAREEQKRLLQQEIKLFEQQFASEEKKVQAGAAPSDSLLPNQRELLKLKRQLAGLEAGIPLNSAPAIADAGSSAD